MVAPARGQSNRESAPGVRSEAADRRALIALEDEWIAHEHDRPVLQRILADDFRHPVFTGDVLDKAGHIAWSVTHVPPPTMSSRFERMNVRLFGDVGIVDGIVDATNAGRDAGRSVFTDVFVFRDGRWQAVHAQETPLRAMQATR